MKISFTLSGLALAFSIAMAALLPSEAAAQSQVVRLFPQGAPGVEVEREDRIEIRGDLKGGKTVTRYTEVTCPEIEIYPAKGRKKSDAAMVVCPGGGYNILAYDLEGLEVKDWLNSVGVTAVILKYRVPRPAKGEIPVGPLQDAQRAISYLRAHAEELGISPDKIGIMGFSAGANLSARASMHFDERSYGPFDEADKVSCRPDFCLLVYPAYLADSKGGLTPVVKIGPDIPPTMIVQAEDDKRFINSSIFYYHALKEAGVPAWMHLYSEGGHGFGLRQTGHAINCWPRLAAEWFEELGLTGHEGRRK